MASLGAVIVKCPVCDDEMPPVVLKTTTLAVYHGCAPRLELQVEPVLDDAWHEQARYEHGNCFSG